MKELIQIQSELKANKGQFNQFGNYYYRSCEDILEAVKPLLAKYECTLVLSDDIVAVADRVYVKAEAILKNKDNDSESVTAYARESETKKGMDSAQITGSASSYARKYALNGLFCIDDAKDADTNESKLEDRNKGTAGRAELEQQAIQAIKDSDMPEAKKTALNKGMPKHSDDFLRNIINGKV